MRTFLWVVVIAVSMWAWVQMPVWANVTVAAGIGWWAMLSSEPDPDEVDERSRDARP